MWAGLRGLVERDVCMLLSCNSGVLDTLKIPAEQRFEKRISQWYDLASRFRNNFSKWKNEEYLTYKRQDRESQQRLQSDFEQETVIVRCKVLKVIDV